MADLYHTVVAANRGDGDQDNVFGDALEERLVEVGVFADIVATCKLVGSMCSNSPSACSLTASSAASGVLLLLLVVSVMVDLSG
jgi:hypothetical protein